MISGQKESDMKTYFFPHRDTLTIAIINSLTSILAGFVIFSAFGYMSHLQGIPVSDLAVDGKKTKQVIKSSRGSFWFSPTILTCYNPMKYES